MDTLFEILLEFGGVIIFFVIGITAFLTKKAQKKPKSRQDYPKPETRSAAVKEVNPPLKSDTAVKPKPGNAFKEFADFMSEFAEGTTGKVLLGEELLSDKKELNHKPPVDTVDDTAGGYSEAEREKTKKNGAFLPPVERQSARADHYHPAAAGKVKIEKGIPTTNSLNYDSPEGCKELSDIRIVNSYEEEETDAPYFTEEELEKLVIFGEAVDRPLYARSYRRRH